MKHPVRITGLLLALSVLASLHLSAQQVDMRLLEGIKPRSIGPAGMSGRVTALDAVLSNPSIIYAGTASGGLWKSVSGGIEWEPIFDDQDVASIGAVAVYQKNPDIVWAGTGEGNPRNSQTSGYGVYRSLDAGKTWVRMGLEETRQIHRVIIHPDNPDIVYVGAQGVAWGDSEWRGVFKTTDGGKTWKKILYTDARTGVADLVMDPSNPNKLFAAMWEFRRWPWFFKSGGPGSALHVTYDGGETWQKRTDADGLPKGELGRIGIAIARSKPNVVYALVESAKNALYRSEDGGRTWQMVNDKEEIGGRPFYYAEIYVDPQNENRVYSIHTLISRSEDGGKSFRVLVPFQQVHPDYHAFWVHPEQPEFLMAGNDGGMAISHDMGKSWRFVENIPVAQYYHIRVDMETPYHVYGGMQDNGSWRGPAYVWRSGGIRNSYWEELFFGDGFDVVPDPADARYGYAMSQGGYLGRYDVQTGYSKFIKPLHPDGVHLRFNWNAAIAQDPFDAGTIYYGSQFVHKSTDRGETWSLMSPDLTTNDTSKQKQTQSGGLTFDVTAAENHTTIITLAPSPVQRGVLWAGTDDGNLQLTRDGGATWTSLSSRLPGAPKQAWIPHIHPSAHQAGEAYVIVNHYRQNDWKPYAYRTRDFGASWERIADDTKVWGHALSIVQDPVEPKLLFLGTEFGLYFSIDGGSTWTKWNKGYPTVSTIDLAIHPREHDLVIGTFGRAAWVIDDIRPLRALAREGAGLLERTLKVYEAPDAYAAEFAQASGIRFAADAMFSGDNRRYGAMISYSVAIRDSSAQAAAPPPPAPGKKGKAGADKPAPVPAPAAPKPADAKPKKNAADDTAKVEIFSPQGELIRTLYQKPDTGINRIYWNLDRKTAPFPSRQPNPNPRAENAAGPVLPGVYTVRVSFRGQQDSTRVRVLPDPRIAVQTPVLEQQEALRREMEQELRQLSEALARLRDAQKMAELVQKLYEGREDSTSRQVVKQARAMQDSIKALTGLVFPAEGQQGITEDRNALQEKLFNSFSYLQPAYEPVNATQRMALAQYRAEQARVAERIRKFLETTWAGFRKQAEAQPVSPFKDLKPLE